jgi:hypothetical protein
MVVHRNAHIISAIPHDKDTNPLCPAARAMAIVAPLDCINIVKINHTRKNKE